MSNSKKNAVEGLSKFEGRDVLQSTIAITNTGDGLSDAMKVDPVEFKHGDTVYVVLECDVTKVQYRELKGTDCLERVHTFKAGTSTTVDKALVDDLLEAQRVAIEEAKGLHRLPYGEEGEEGEGE